MRSVGRKGSSRRFMKVDGLVKMCSVHDSLRPRTRIRKEERIIEEGWGLEFHCQCVGRGRGVCFIEKVGGQIKMSIRIVVGNGSLKEKKIIRVS